MQTNGRITNLELADPPGKPRHELEQLLHTCNEAFQRAEETVNVVRTYQMMIQHAANERRADQARYNLAETLESAGQFAEAARHYQRIQDTNYVKHAERRLAIVARKAGRIPAN